MFSVPRRAVMALMMLTLSAGVAVAQSPACDSWRAEFARLRGGGDPGGAQRVGAELSRTINYSRQIGCDRGGFFGGGIPAECAGLSARIRQLQGQFQSLQGQDGGASQRRAQLASLIEANCQSRGVYQTPPALPTGVAPAQPRRERSFFEALFGVDPPRSSAPDPIYNEPDFDPPPDDGTGQRFGAGTPVCVRTCDGFFFPLSNSPGGREGQEQMCAALCPSSSMQVFYMSGNGEIDSAVSRGGQPYSSLANASKYTRSFDSACGCRKQGESWIEALRDAERMLDAKRGDLIVTAAKAEELSKPRLATPRRGKQPPVPAVAAAAPAAVSVEAVPTAGTESAGIGPQNAGSGDTLRQGGGTQREITGPNGEKKTIRIVAPNLSPQHVTQ